MWKRKRSDCRNSCAWQRRATMISTHLFKAGTVHSAHDHHNWISSSLQPNEHLTKYFIRFKILIIRNAPVYFFPTSDPILISEYDIVQKFFFPHVPKWKWHIFFFSGWNVFVQNILVYAGNCHFLRWFIVTPRVRWLVHFFTPAVNSTGVLRCVSPMRGAKVRKNVKFDVHIFISAAWHSNLIMDNIWFCRI